MLFLFRLLKDHAGHKAQEQQRNNQPNGQHHRSLRAEHRIDHRAQHAHLNIITTISLKNKYIFFLFW